MVNEIILSDELTIDSIQNIIESVIDIDPNRNDSIIVKSYRFTNLPLFIRIYKWQHWPKNIPIGFDINSGGYRQQIF